MISSKSFFYVFLLFISLLYSDIYEEQLNLAINDLYNFRLDSCSHKLHTLKSQYPESPIVPFLLVSTEWQRSLLHDDPSTSYEVINAGIDKITPFYHEMISRYPDDPHYKLFLGSLYGLKARINLAQSDWVAVVIAGSKGYHYIKQSIKDSPQLHDAGMPIGTIEYFLCKNNAPTQAIGKLFGLESDCSKAIDKLERASNKGEYSWIEARNVLSYIYLYIERDYVKALKVTSSLVEDFPKHPYFAYLHAEALLRLEEYDQFNERISILEQFYSVGPKNQKSECLDKFLYLRALENFQNKKYSTSIKYCDLVISNYNTEFQWVLGFAHLIRGKSLEYQGNRTQALDDYRLAESYLDFYPEQEEARRLISSSSVLK